MALALCFGAPAAAGATTYTVASIADDNGTTPCNSSNVCQTLRDAVNFAPSGSTIQLGPYASASRDAIDIAANDPTIYTINSPLDIGGSAGAKSLTITGAGQTSTTIKETGSGRVFTIAQPTGPTTSAVTLGGLTITGGNGTSQGGAIFAVDSALTLNGVGVDGNGALGQLSGQNSYAGAVYISNGVLTVTNSELSNNTAQGSPGGGGGFAGAVFLGPGSTGQFTNDTFSGNQALGGSGGSALGGAISIQPGVTVTIDASTFSDNVTKAGTGATGGGGGVFSNNANVSMVNSTVTGNTSANLGGGLFLVDNGGHSVSLASDTIADNTAAQGANLALSGAGGSLSISDVLIANVLGEGNCFIAFQPTTEHNNLENTSPSTCGLTSSTDVVGKDPKLGPLQDNGGPTQTMALEDASPAIGAGAQCPTSDQRGIARPSTATCDVGAFQTRAPIVVTLNTTILVTAIQLNGTVDPEGTAVESCTFEYARINIHFATDSSATEPFLPKKVLCVALPGNGVLPVRVLALRLRLKPNSLYKFRLVARSAGGTGSGAILKFRTPKLPTVSKLRIKLAPAGLHKSRVTVSYRNPYPSLARITVQRCVRLTVGGCRRWATVFFTTRLGTAGRNRFGIKGLKLKSGSYRLKLVLVYGGLTGPATIKLIKIPR